MHAQPQPTHKNRVEEVSTLPRHRRFLYVHVKADFPPGPFHLCSRQRLQMPTQPANAARGSTNADVCVSWCAAPGPFLGRRDVPGPPRELVATPPSPPRILTPPGFEPASKPVLSDEDGAAAPGVTVLITVCAANLYKPPHPHTPRAGFSLALPPMAQHQNITMHVGCTPPRAL